MLGNDDNGAEADGIAYTFTIPSSDTLFSLIYYYAVVLQYPLTHTAAEQPRFRATIFDVNAGVELNCVSFDFYASGGMPGFRLTGNNNTICKEWTPVTVDLGAYAGKTIRLEFNTSDCVFTEHFGYAYVAVASRCNGLIEGNFYCDPNDSLTLKAPFGYKEYSWYADNSFSAIVGSSQNLSLAGTNSGGTYPVIVYPYKGYGCIDTFYTTIKPASGPVANAGIDRNSCIGSQVQIGAPPVPGYSYLWQPASLVDDPKKANPRTSPLISQPTDFIIITTDDSTKCKARDTVRVIPEHIDTTVSIQGKLDYCVGDTVQTSFFINNANAVVQWYKEEFPMPGATANLLRPLKPGKYWAILKQNNCSDTTSPIIIAEVPLLQADFTIDKEVQCLHNPVYYANTSRIHGNDSAAFQWQVSDGSISNTINLQKVYNQEGIYQIRLTATSSKGCVNSIEKTMRVVSDCNLFIPNAFTPNDDGLNDVIRPFLAGQRFLKRFSVFSRYGNILFATSHAGEGWNGITNGKLMPPGVYIWMVEYVENNKSVTEKGTFLLVR